MKNHNVVTKAILLATTKETRTFIDALVISDGTFYVTTGKYYPAIVLKNNAKVKVARHAAVGRVITNSIDQIDVKKGGVVWWVVSPDGAKLSGGIGALGY